MRSTSLLTAAVLCVGIRSKIIVPRQGADIITPVADPTLVPDASGKPTTPTITVTATVTTTAIETSFVTAINNVTIEVTETETDLQTEFVTAFVTNFVTNFVTDIETLPAITNSVTEVVTDLVTLPVVTVVNTLTVSKPAVTVTATKTIVEVAPNPIASLCPGGNEEIFEATRGIYLIICGKSKQTFDLIPGGQTTSSVYDCATLCDSLTAAGVDCSAGIFEADSSLCFPQGVGASSMTVNAAFDTAVLNTTVAAQGASKRSSWLH